LGDAVPALLLVADSRLELWQRQARLHASDDIPDHLAAIADQVRIDRLRRVRLSAARVVEAGGGHADDLVGNAAQKHALADDARVAAELLPQSMTEDDDSRGTVRLGRSIKATHRRNDTEHVEEGPHRAHRNESPRVALLGEDRRARRPGRRRVEEIRTLHDVERLARTHRLLEQIHRRQIRLHDDDAVEVARGDRMQEDPIDRAEDRGVGADAQRENSQCRAGEPRPLAELSECVAKIARQRVHPFCPSHGALPLMRQPAQRARDVVDVAEALERRSPRRLRIHSGANVLGNEPVDVEANLVLDVRPNVASPEAHVPAPGWNPLVTRVPHRDARRSAARRA
jgi:hypothetical protein